MASLVNLNLLAPPQIIETLEFETIFNERKAQFIALYPVEERAEVEKTLSYESEPIVKLLQENSYKEMLLRQRINNAAQAVMLAYATGNDLDVLAVNFNTERLIITPADMTTNPITPAVMESDNDFRLRTQQAFEGITTAGPTASYEYHARSADGRIADVAAESPTPAYVVVSVLSRENDGAASNELLTIVEKALNKEHIRPVGDRVEVRSAEITHYQIIADLFIYDGPEYELVLKAAKTKLNEYINTQRRLGRDIRLSAIYAALMVEGVQRVVLHEPLSDLVLSESQAAYCTDYRINFGGYDE